MPEVPGWQGRFFEDFAVGDVYVHRLGRTVLEVDNAWFSLLTQNTAPIHVDRHYSAGTEFGRPLVDSTFTLALVTGQSVSDVSENVIANLGWEEVRLPAPGVRGRHHLLRVARCSPRAPRGSRAEAGIVTVRSTGYNQDGVVVITFVRTVMVYRRGYGPAPRRPRPPSGPGAAR